MTVFCSAVSNRTGVKPRTRGKKQLSGAVLIRIVRNKAIFCVRTGVACVEQDSGDD